MFDEIPKKEKEMILYGALIFGCLTIIAQLIYLGFFHYPITPSLTIFTLIFITPFTLAIYKLVKLILIIKGEKKNDYE